VTREDDTPQLAILDELHNAIDISLEAHLRAIEGISVVSWKVHGIGVVAMFSQLIDDGGPAKSAMPCAMNEDKVLCHINSAQKLISNELITS
jgi:hypothetical protein